MKKCIFPFNLTTVFLALVILSTGINLVFSVKTILTQSKIHQYKPFEHSGELFKDIKPLIAQEQYATYLSDRNFGEPAHQAHFFQTQNALAPVVLDHNGKIHRYIIFDFTKTENALKVFKQLNPKPVKITPEGIMLAETRQ